jgi:hypothetical protein
VFSASLPSLPPRCLKNFRIQKVRPQDAGLPTDVDFNSYLLRCSCGRDLWRVSGNWFHGTTEFVGPLIVECVQCAVRHRLIERSIDGFNGEIGDGVSEPDEASDVWSCPNCGKPEGCLIASFGYQFEPSEDIALRQHDYFDTFILTHVCQGSTNPVQITVFDCA